MTVVALIDPAGLPESSRLDPMPTRDFSLGAGAESVTVEVPPAFDAPSASPSAWATPAPAATAAVTPAGYSTGTEPGRTLAPVTDLDRPPVLLAKRL
jgi:hypothetical protein